MSTAVVLTCANCSRPVLEEQAEPAGWRYLVHGDERRLFCGLCTYWQHRDPD